jgi:hypothetical protein
MFRGKSATLRSRDAHRFRAAHLPTHHAASRGANGSLMISHTSRTIRSNRAPFRWECPCQTPAVLLATYDPGGKINIKVRDRYWHLFGFGTVQAICPRCAAEHILDLRQIASLLDQSEDEDYDDHP